MFWCLKLVNHLSNARTALRREVNNTLVCLSSDIVNVICKFLVCASLNAASRVQFLFTATFSPGERHRNQYAANAVEALAVADGEIWASGVQIVQAFDEDGKFRFHVTEDWFGDIYGIALYGEQLLVADFCYGHVVKRRRADGAVVRFAFPYLGAVCCLAVSGQGFVFATCWTTDLVYVLTGTGTILRTFGGSGQSDGQLKTPCGIAIDETRKVIVVADRDNHRIQVAVFS